MAVEVQGVRQTINTLRKIDQGLYWQSVNRIKAAAEPLRADIQASIPTAAPLSGWAHKGRTGWTKKNTKVVTQYGGRYGRGVQVMPLVKIVLKGAAASIYDMAGRGSSGKTEQGMAFIDGLDTITGQASRAAWPAAERRLPQVRAAVIQAAAQVVRDANKELERRR